MEDYPAIKINLHERCLDIVTRKIHTSQHILDSLKESASNETKSSAGDKHETGRAMVHLEQEKGVRQLSEAMKLKQVLDRIDPKVITNQVSLGSLVITNKGRFYFSVAAGKIEMGGVVYFALSLSSPVAAAFLGAQKNQEISFNGQIYRIEEVY